MKSRILLLLFLGMILISSVSAMSSVYSDFQDGTHSATITNGDSISFNADFGTVDKPMSISAKLYDSNDDLVYTFVDKSVNDYTFSNTYSISNTIYGNSGNYHVVLIATDRAGYSTGDTLSLTVNSNNPPNNHAPVITSSPLTNVDEGNTYNYHVTAVDADHDTLTYSLPIAPSWLSINSATGLISGIAPLVSSNTAYNIIVGVSDSVNPLVTQSYTLTVNNIPNPNPPQNPEITIISPESGKKYCDINHLNLEVTTNDVVDRVFFRLDDGSNIEMNNPSNNDFTYTLHIDNGGNHFVTFYPADSSGNIIGHGETVSFSVQNENENNNGNYHNYIVGGSGSVYTNQYGSVISSGYTTPTSYTTSTSSQTPSPNYYVSNPTQTMNSSDILNILVYILIGIVSLGILFVVFLLGRTINHR